MGLPSLDEIRRERVRRDAIKAMREGAGQAADKLSTYIRAAWHVVEPGTPYIHNWHVDAISEHLEAAANGQIRNLVINVPPGHMKSLSVCCFFPSWLWLRRPEKRMLFASYAESLALRDSVKCRNILESEWYRDVFQNDWALAEDQNAKGFYENTRRGSRVCLSVGGSTTGLRGDVIVVDDPLNVKDSYSKSALEEVLFWWDQSMANRLNDLRTGVRILMMQRLRQNDLAGHVLKGGGWDHLKLPSEFVPEKRCFTSIGWQDPRTYKGELLFPEKFPAEQLQEERRRMGSSGYAAQHQQEPTPDGGGAFKKQWFKYYQRVGEWVELFDGGERVRRIMFSDLWIFVTADLALSLRDEACYTVIATWGVTSVNDLLLLDLWRDRAEAPDVKHQIWNTYRRDNPSFIGVEKAHYGAALIQDLRREGLPIRELIPDKDKLTRAMPMSVRYEGGYQNPGGVFHPRSAPWLADFESELLFFPNGEFDDQVDVASYAGVVLTDATRLGSADILRGKPVGAVQAGSGGMPKLGKAAGGRRVNWDNLSS